MIVIMQHLSLTQNMKRNVLLYGADEEIVIETMQGSKQHHIVCDVTKPLPLRRGFYKIIIPCISIV